MRPKTSLLILMLALFSVSISFGQNLSKHRWEQRVLIVTAKDTHLLKEQMDSLTKNIKGLQERKLAIYQVTPTGYAKGTKMTNWINTNDFYREVTKRDSDFEIILIGLDGGVKLRQTKLLTTEKLFTLIDGMPIRRAELKN